MYDITDKISFVRIYKWIQEIKTKCTNNPKIFLVGNKTDLEENRVVSIEESQELSNELGAPHFECSSKNNINNVNYCIHEIIKTLMKDKNINNKKENLIKLKYKKSSSNLSCICNIL